MALQLEYATLRAPFESVGHITRNCQKIVHRDTTLASNDVKALKAFKPKAFPPDKKDKETCARALSRLVGNLQGLKRKLEDSERASVRHWQRCKIRMDHINQVADCGRAPAMRPPLLTRSLSAVLPSSTTASSAAAAAPSPPLLQRSESTPLPSVRDTGKDDIKTETKTPVLTQTIAPSPSPTPSSSPIPLGGDDSDDEELMAMMPSLPWLPPDEVEQKRLSRLFIDHLLRNGHYNTAIELMSQTDIRELVDLEVFLSAKKVVDGITGRSCTRALAWCGENRSRLARIHSTLEFNLRVQEFIELIRSKDNGGAILYAQKHFPLWADAHMNEIQEAMMCLAFAHIPIDDDTNGHSNGHTNGDISNGNDDDDDTGVADMKEGRDGKSSDEKLTPLRTSSPSMSPSPPSSATGSGHVSRSTSSTTISSTTASAMSPQRSSSSSISAAGRRPSIGTASVTASPRRTPSTPIASSNGNGHTTNGNGHTNGHAHSNGNSNGHTSPSIAGTAAATNGDSNHGNNSLMAKYRRYMSLDRWNELVQLFRADLYALNGLPSRSLLSIHLQAGLAALKTPFCGAHGDHNDECPVCSPAVTTLASPLPVSVRLHSVLVCRLSGAIMDEYNPPMALPNGFVYSKAALTAMAAANDGIIKCPRSLREYPFSECRIAYVL